MDQYSLLFFWIKFVDSYFLWRNWFSSWNI